MKIFLDCYLNNNLGDDLMISTICRRYPQHHFYVSNVNRLSSIACKEENLYIIPSIIPNPRLSFLRIFNKFISYFGIPKIQIIKEFRKKGKYNIYLAVGGSIYMQVTKKSWINKVRDAKYIMNHCDRSYIIGCNFGPYSSDSFKNEHFKLFAQCDGVTFRDKYSYALFSELPNTMCYPDILFQLQLPWMPLQEVGISVLSLNNRGISNHVEMYLDGLVNLIEHLQKKCKIVLISFCENEGDLEACKVVKKRLGPAGENVDIYNHENVDNTLQRISHFSAMVCTRFHASVLAMDMGMPFLPVSYSYKTDCMLNDAEYKGYRWDIKKGIPLDLQKGLQSLISSVASIEYLKTSAKGHFEGIDSQLCSSEENYEKRSV